jgi:hypothetical protein
MENLKIVQKEKTNNKIKLKVVENDNGFTIRVDDLYDFWLAEFTNNSDGSLAIRYWTRDLSSDYKLTKLADSCDRDSITLNLKRGS